MVKAMEVISDKKAVMDPRGRLAGNIDCFLGIPVTNVALNLKHCIPLYIVGTVQRGAMNYGKRPAFIYDRPCADKVSKYEVPKHNVSKDKVSMDWVSKDKGQCIEGQIDKGQRVKGESVKGKIVKAQCVKGQSTKDKVSQNKVSKDSVSNVKLTKDNMSKDKMSNKVSNGPSAELKKISRTDYMREGQKYIYKSVPFTYHQVSCR